MRRGPRAVGPWSVDHHRHLARQRQAPRADGQLLFGIAQGATDPELRRRSIAEIVELDFDDAGSVARALADALAPARRREQGAAARRLYERDFSPATVIPRFAAWYEGVVSRRTSRTPS